MLYYLCFTPPPQNKEFYGHGGFPAGRRHFFQASIKLAQPFPAPEFRAGFRQNGFFADFYFWAAGFSSRIFSPDFFSSFLWGKSAQKNPPGKSRSKSSKIYTTKIADTFLQRGRANRIADTNFMDTYLWRGGQLSPQYQSPPGCLLRTRRGGPWAPPPRDVQVRGNVHVFSCCFFCVGLGLVFCLFVLGYSSLGLVFVW